jgi:mono/diheme cytochrome c family protein
VKPAPQFARFGPLAGALTATALVACIVPLLGARQDDDEERADQLALGKRTFENNCLICHAEEMATRQRLSPVQWKTEVEKMVGWGAPVPEDELARLIDYLATTFALDIPATPPGRMSARDVLAVDQPVGGSTPPLGDATRGAAIYTAQCATCHGAKGQGGDLGPNLIERPILLRPADYARVVREGLRRMPGYRLALNPAQEADVLAWLRTRRSP